MKAALYGHTGCTSIYELSQIHVIRVLCFVCFDTYQSWLYVPTISHCISLVVFKFFYVKWFVWMNKIKRALNRVHTSDKFQRSSLTRVKRTTHTHCCWHDSAPVVKVVMWSRAGAHLTKPGWSKPHTHSNPTNLALFRHKITLYRFNHGAHAIAVGAQMGAGGWAP